MTHHTPDDPFQLENYRVDDVRQETPDTYTLAMSPVGGDGMTFLPGQFNMLYHFGVGEVPISISGDPDKGGPLLHTVRATGSVTNELVTVKPGDVLGVRGPYGTAWPVEVAEGQDVLFVSGGLGTAPLRPAVYKVLSGREKHKKVSLLVGARTPEDLLFPDLLREWGDRPDMDVDITVDKGSSGWDGKVGLVTALIPGADFDPKNTTAFVCGPEIMMKFTVMELEKAGVPQDRIWVSMERNMKCGVGLCGHCQCGPDFICKDGAVFRFSDIAHWFNTEEV